MSGASSQNGVGSVDSASDGGRTGTDRGQPGRGRNGEVLEAAAVVFARRGYAAATVQDVADELGILKGSLYYYIRAKEDLLYQLLRGIHEQADRILAETVEGPGDSPLERLLHYFGRQLDWNARNPGKVSIYYKDLGQLSAERLSEIRRRRRLLENRVVDVISQAQQAGEVTTAIAPEVLAAFVFGVMIWPHRWFGPQRSVSAADLTRDCSEFVRCGLSGPGPRRARS